MMRFCVIFFSVIASYIGEEWQAPPHLWEEALSHASFSWHPCVGKTVHVEEEGLDKQVVVRIMLFDHLWTSKYMPRTVISDEQNGGLQIFPSHLPWKHNIQHLLWSWLQVNCNSVSQVQQGSLLNWLTQKLEYVCPHLLLLFRCIFPRCFLLSPCWGGGHFSLSFLVSWNWTLQKSETGAVEDY